MIDMPPPFDAYWFKILVGLVVGLSLGSFITMLSYRLPRRLSIVRPGSFCPSCKKPLLARDLVPVASYVCFNGKCSHCKKKIGSRYVIIEMATGAGGALALATYGFQPVAALALTLLTIVMTGIVIVIENRK